jgi:hypothetical protein
MALERIAAMGSCRIGAPKVTLKIAQRTKQVGPEYWKWSAWIAGPAEELNRIKEVVWILHSTFVNPVRRTKSRKSNFRLDTAGWGEFKINAELIYDTGGVEKLSHWLELKRDLVTFKRNSEYSPSKISADFNSDYALAPRRTVFVSYTRDSVALMRELTSALAARGIDASIDADIPVGVEFRRWITDEIYGSDATIAIISNNTSVWQDSEIKLALESNNALFIVSVGNLTPEFVRILESYEGPRSRLLSNIKIDSENKIDTKYLVDEIVYLLKTSARGK